MKFGAKGENKTKERIISYKFSIRFAEVFGIVGLTALAFFFIRSSWRKWPDPLIDFGRELYIPWRLANGALLYRDVDDFYGPLSQYFNALLFRVFGDGMMVLVWANLLIFTVIAGLLYRILRTAWGAGVAFVSSAIFISVFGFSQFLVGNYSYAAPYAHEATHGLLVCLILILVLLRWLERPSRFNTGVTGFSLGLAAILKPEILLAAAGISGAALAMAYARRIRLTTSHFAIWLACAATPTGLFACFFAIYVPWRTALSMSCRAWLTIVVSKRFVGDVIQRSFLGFDEPLKNLTRESIAFLIAGILLVAILGAVWSSQKIAKFWAQNAIIAAIICVVVWIAWTRIDWIEIGRCLVGLIALYWCYCWIDYFRCAKSRSFTPMQSCRVLTSTLALALMARMILNPRIYQFGFYQAALAGTIAPAVILSELTQLSFGSRRSKLLIALPFLALFAIGTFRLSTRSLIFLKAKTFSVGTGRNQFFSLPPELDPTGLFVGTLSNKLSTLSPGRTLLVLPEGEMINYLCHLNSPIAPFFFFSAATSGEREAEIVSQLSASPPDCIVVITRDLREYGIQRYGQEPGQGEEILQWVSLHYRLASKIGGDPLDPSQHGAVILSLIR